MIIELIAISFIWHESFSQRGWIQIPIPVYRAGGMIPQTIARPITQPGRRKDGVKRTRPMAVG